MNGLRYILLRNFRKGSNEAKLGANQGKSENLVFEFRNKVEHLEKIWRLEIGQIKQYTLVNVRNQK